MKEALAGPKHVKSLKNKYLSLFIATVLILCSFGSYAQLPARDTTRDLKYIEAEGYSWRNGQFLVSLRLANDTPRLALRDSGAIAYKGANLWTWDGVYWNQKSSATVIAGGPGVDSVIISDVGVVSIYSFHNLSPRIFELDKFIVHVGDNYDSTMWVGYNFRGDAVDSTDRNLILVFTRDGFDHTDTTVTRNGKQRRGIVFFATGIANGSVLDTIIRFPVLDSLNTPVVSPGINDAWLVGTNPTGGGNPFIGHANNIAKWNGSAYVYDTAHVGDLIYRVSNQMVSKFNGTSWIRIGKLLTHPGGDGYGILIKIGTTDNQGLTLITNNTDRLRIGPSGAFTFVTGVGTGTRLTTLNPSGTLGTIAVPNSIKKYLTGYNTYGSLLDTVRAAISLTTTGSSGAATYNGSTGVLNIPNYAGGGSNLNDVVTVGNWTESNFGITRDWSGSGYGVHEPVVQLAVEPTDEPVINLVKDLGAGPQPTKMAWDGITYGGSNAGSKLYYPVTTGTQYIASSINGTYFANSNGDITISGLTPGLDAVLQTDNRILGSLRHIDVAGQQFIIGDYTGGTTTGYFWIDPGAGAYIAGTAGEPEAGFKSFNGLSNRYYSFLGDESNYYADFTHTYWHGIKYYPQDYSIQIQADSITFKTPSSLAGSAGYVPTLVDPTTGYWTWQASGGGGPVSFSKQEFTGSTSTTITVSHTYTSGSVDVFKNGILLSSAEYTEATGTTVTLTSARISSDIIIVKYRY